MNKIVIDKRNNCTFQWLRFIFNWLTVFSGALERSKHMHRKYTELAIKEMLTIAVKLARCSLRSILYAIVFILIHASYT